MSDFRIGCQTITWGENQREQLPEVFDEIAAAGFDGVEVGFRHIRTTDPKELLRMLESRNLVLAASHVGGNLADPGQASGERGLLGEILAYLPVTGTRLLMYSGLRYVDDAQFARDLDMLNRAADKCARQGVRLLYHNHNWEFQNGGRVVHALLENGDDSLGFCPDIGWIMKGGADAVQFLETAGSRVGAIHFKDFATAGDGVDTVLLGDGIVPLEVAAEWIRPNLDGLWMIAEQDRTDVPTSQVALSNADYLRRMFPGGAK